MKLPPKQLVFGPVVIEWDAMYRFPIAVDHEKPGWFVTQCEIRYRYGKGDYFLKIRENYSSDGASIPWIIRIVPGFAKLDWHLLAALPHDFIIDNPDLLPRSVADGIFISVLIALAENRKDSSKKLTKLQGHLMFLAVWSWTVWNRLVNPPNNASQPPHVDEVPSTQQTSTERQAEAVSDATEVTKEETATPPVNEAELEKQEQGKP
jgi:hypothetical protein